MSSRVIAHLPSSARGLPPPYCRPQPLLAGEVRVVFQYDGPFTVRPAQSSLRRPGAVARRRPDDAGDRRYHKAARHRGARPHHRGQGNGAPSSRQPRPANRSSRKQPKQIAAVHESGSGPEPTSRDVHSAVAIRGKADLTRTSKFGRDDPQSTLGKPARETTRMMATSARRWTTKCFEFCLHA